MGWTEISIDASCTKDLRQDVHKCPPQGCETRVTGWTRRRVLRRLRVVPVPCVSMMYQDSCRSHYLLAFLSLSQGKSAVPCPALPAPLTLILALCPPPSPPHQHPRRQDKTKTLQKKHMNVGNFVDSSETPIKTIQLQKRTQSG